MMNRPPINDLEKKAGCRYLLVSAVSKRARQLLAQPGTDKPSDDVALSIAIGEMDTEQLNIKRVGKGDATLLMD